MTKANINYWRLAPGEHGFLWVEQKNNGCVAVGWAEVLANNHLLTRFPKISGGSFGRFGEGSAFCHFGAIVTTCRAACYETLKFRVAEKAPEIIGKPCLCK